MLVRKASSTTVVAWVMAAAAALVLGMLVLSGTAKPAQAATGDIVRTLNVDPPPQCGSRVVSEGLAFDGKELLTSCIYNHTIVRVDPATGANLGSYDISGMDPDSIGIAALSWDAKHNQLWMGSQQSDGPEKIYKVSLNKQAGTGTATKAFDIPWDINQFGTTAGLAYDAADDTLWYSTDTGIDVYHFKTDGTELGSFSTGAFSNGQLTGFLTTGIAIADDSTLYLGNNPRSKIYSAGKDGSNQPLLFADLRGKGAYDPECDNTTFKDTGKSVLWTKGPNDYELNAVEVPAGQCAQGGVVGSPPASTTTTITSDVPDPSVVGQSYTVSYNVTADSQGAGTPTGDVTVSDGVDSCTATVAAGQCTLSSTTAGSKALTATYAGDTNFNGSTSASESHTVDKADTTTTITSDNPDPSNVGQAVTVDYTVAVNTPGSGTPTGNVTVSDGTDNCTGTVAAGRCDLTLTTSGARTLTATYEGDSDFNSSNDTESHTVNAAGPTDSASGTVGGGGTVSTGTGSASPSDPVNTSVKTPVAGTVTINETTVTQGAPSGFTFFGQQVNITAPQATAQNPLVLTFVLDATLIPAGKNANSVEVFRNGALVGQCTDTSGTASPDPCVFKRETLGDGDVAITVLTSSASAWNFGADNAPVAFDDSATTDEDTAAVIDVLSNDTDADGDSLNVVGSSLSTPAHGKVALITSAGPDKGKVLYTPRADYNGPDSFKYIASDGSAQSNAATVNITVNPVNDPPVAANDSVTTNEDTAKLITLSATDVDNGSLTYKVTSLPAHGKLYKGDSQLATDEITSASSSNPVTLSGNQLTYKPDPNYNNSGGATADTFKFLANDGNLDSNEATVSVTVTAVNDVPIAVDDSYSTNQGNALTVNAPGVLGNDTDVDSANITAVLVSGPAHAQQFALNANGSFTYTPSSGFSGKDTFTYKANDGSVDSNTATVTITVNPVGTSAPMVTSVSPLDQATGVSRSTKVTATFNVAMKAKTLKSTTFILTVPGKRGPTQVSASVSCNNPCTTATLTPSKTLAANTTYTATVKGTVEDASGRKLGSDYVWRFTTGG